jgi:hypothetical protein
VNISVPNTSAFEADFLNDHGQVVGAAYVPGGSPVYQAFIWQDGVAALVPESEYFTAINDKGIAIGLPEYPKNETAPGQYVAYDSTTGVSTVHNISLNAPIEVVQLAENGELFGQELKLSGNNRGRVTPFSYKRNIRKYRIDGDKGSILRGANDAGDLLVQCRNPHICLYDLYSNGVFTPIDVPGAEQTFPYAIMPSGQVVGYANESSGDVPFVETNGTYQTFPDAPLANDLAVVAVLPSGNVFFGGGLLESNYVLANGKYYALSVPGATSTFITAVNTRGDLLGDWYDAQNTAHPFYAKCAEGKFCTAIKN